MPTSGTRVPRGGRSKGSAPKRKAKRTPAAQIAKSVAKGTKTGAATSAVSKSVRRGKRTTEPIRLPRSVSRSLDRNIQRDIRRTERDRRRYEQREERNESLLEKAIEGGVVGLVDEDAAAAGRKFLYGTENPSAGELAIGVIPGARAAKGAARLSKAVIGGGKAATATKTERLASKARAAESAGKARKATRARKAEAKAAAKAENKARKADTVRRAERAAETTGQRAKRIWKAKQPASLHKAGRQVKRRRRIEAASTIGAASTGAATVGAGTVLTTGEAIKEDIEQGKPLRTVKTTARVIPGMPAALIGDAVDVAKYVAGDEKAGERAFKSYENYLDTVTKVAKGGEPGRRAVQKDVGLVPVISGGLTVAGAAKPFRTSPSDAIVPSRKARRLSEKAETGGTKGERAAAERKRGEMSEPRRQAKRERTEEARRRARTKQRIEALQEDDLRVTGRGRKRLDRRVYKLSKRPINKDVSYADAIQLLAREGLYGVDPGFALRELKARRAALRKPSKDISDNDVATRDVMDAIIENPSVLRDKALTETIQGFAKARARRSAERHTERTGAPQNRPDPVDEDARLLHLQRAEDIRTRSERIPHALRGRTKVEPKARQDAEVAIRAEAKKFRKQAIRLRHQGKKQEAEMAILEARAREAIINRARKAEALERRASRIEAGQARAREGEPSPAQMRAQAVALRRQVDADNAKLRQEAVAETTARMTAKGYSEPIYFRESDVSDKGNLNVAATDDYLGSKIPPKEKRRTGALAEEGRIDESAETLLSNFHRERIATEMRRHVREMLDDNLFDPDGKGNVRTGAEWRKLERQGKIPPGMEPFPAQEWGRVLQHGTWQEAQQLLDDPLMAEVRVAKGLEGKKYGLVPSAAKQEFRDQMDSVGRGLKAARVAGRIQSMAMLATSPLWFQFQLIASPIAAAFRHPNPARAAKVGYRMIREWRKIPKTKRIRFQTEFGGTSADVFDMRQIEAGVRPQTVRGMEGAMSLARQSAPGRLLTHLASGGPLIAGNRRFEAGVRTFVALLEADKQINPPRVLRATKSIAKAQDEVWKQMKQLRGKSLEEQLDWLNSKEGRASTKRIRDNVDDGMGNWTALSSRERHAAAVAVFYPFLRFSAKWLAVVSPRDRPLTYAFAMNAAQQNAQELEQAGEPSFFSDWGDVVVHGSKNSKLSLGRVAPGSNALVEAIGQGELNLAAIGRLTQPLIGGTLTALAGQDTFGEETDLSFGEQVAKNAASLSPLTRPLSREIDPQSNISKAFAKAEGRDERGYLENLFVPDLVNPLAENKGTAKLSKALDKSKSPDSGDWISRALEGETPPNPRRYAKRYVEASERASEGRDELTAILEDLGLDNPEDAKWIDAFFSAASSIRAKKARSSSPFGSNPFSGSNPFGGNNPFG